MFQITANNARDTVRTTANIFRLGLCCPVLCLACVSSGRRHPVRNATPKIAVTVADEIDRLFQEADTLSISATLRRDWNWPEGKSGTTIYKAESRQTRGVFTTTIFEGDEIVARAEQKPGAKSTDIQRNDQVDGCLYGTLIVAWLGGSESASPPSFAERIRDSTYGGVKIFENIPCHVFRYHTADEREPYYKREDDYMVPVDRSYPSYPFPRWWVTREYYEEGKPPWTVVTRSYESMWLETPPCERYNRSSEFVASSSFVEQ